MSDAALAAYFAAADVYLSLSAHEGFGVPLVEAMAAGVPVVARGGRRGGRDGGRRARSCWPASDPSYVAAALHRVCTDDALRATADRRRAGGACRRCPLDAVAPRSGGRGGHGGRGTPMKVAFVTPRYGPQVMGGAETAARQLAEHLVAETDWEAEAYSTCALDPHTWADELEPGDSVINGVPGAPLRLGPRAPPRLLRPRRARSAWPRSWPPGTRAAAGSTTTGRSRPT